MLYVSWRDNIPNAVLDGDLPNISEKIARRCLPLVGHYKRHQEIPFCQLVLRRPAHGHHGKVRIQITYTDVLEWMGLMSWSHLRMRSVRDNYKTGVLMCFRRLHCLDVNFVWMIYLG